MDYTRYTKRAIMNEIIQTSLNLNNTEKMDVFISVHPHVKGLDIKIYPNKWENQEDDSATIWVSMYYEGMLSDRDLMLEYMHNLNGVMNNILLGNPDPLNGITFKNDTMVGIRKRQEEKEQEEQEIDKGVY